MQIVFPQLIGPDRHNARTCGYLVASLKYPGGDSYRFELSFPISTRGYWNRTLQRRKDEHFPFTVINKHRVNRNDYITDFKISLEPPFIFRPQDTAKNRAYSD